MKTSNNSSESGGHEISRREFLGTTAVAGAGLWLASCSPEAEKPIAAAPETPIRKINVALIGCGAHGQVLLESLQVITSIKFVAVADIWDYNRKLVMGRMKSIDKPVNGYRDHEDLLANEKNLDAVVVATPDFWHAPITNACLKAGLHVYCEKMMSNTIEGARSMVKTMLETGKLLQIGHQRRSNPRYLYALNTILRKEQIIGKITSAHAQWNRSVAPDMGFPKHSEIPPEILAKYGYKDMHQLRNWHWFKGMSAGGPLANLGSHQIDIFNWFLDSPPRSVIGSGGVDYYKTHEWFDNAMVIFEYPRPDGSCLRAFYQNQTTSSDGGGYYEKFLGDEGRLKISENPEVCGMMREERSTKGWDKFPLKYADPVASHALWAEIDEVNADPSSRELYPYGNTYKIPVSFAKKMHQPHLENFFAAIRGTAKLNCPGDIAFASEYVIHKAVEAVETGKRIVITKEETEA